jgi:iron complex outermembrane receptor protein
MSKIYSMDLEELMNTKVSIATKTEQSINETPAIVSVITAEEIRNMGAREFEDILQTIPGFELNRGYAGYYSVGIRGVKDSRSTSKLLILVDGVPNNQIFYGNSLPWGYDVNIDDIEKIEIIRGPGSALYGRNAFSGVINIINKNARTSEKLMVKGGLGTFNTQLASVSFGYSKNKFNVFLAVRKINTDVTDVKFDNGFGRIVPWNLYRNNYSFNTKITYGNFTFTGMYLDLYGGATFTDSKIENRTANYSITYNKSFSPKLSFNAKFYGHNSKYIEDLEQIPSMLDYPLPSELGGNGTIKYMDVWPLGVYYKPQNKEYLYGIEAEIKYKLSTNNDLLAGLQTDYHGVIDVIIPSNFNFATGAPIKGLDRNNQVNYELGWFTNNGHEYYNTAFLIQDIWYPIKNIGLTLGIRYDIDSEIGSTINPRSALVLSPFKNTSIKLLYGRAYRAPSPCEQYVTLGYAIGNKNLKPEIINTYELSISNRYKNINQSASFFINKLTDMIYAARIIYIDPNNKYYNIGKNTSIGVEYENKLIIGKNLFSYLNYSYTHSVNTDSINGRDTTFNHPDVAPHKLNFGINYSFLKHFNFNVNMYYRSKMGRFKIKDPDVFVKNNIGDYAIFNSTIQINNYFLNGLSLKFSIYNIFDKKYYSQDNQHLYQPPQPGRQIIASIVYTIK